jgi:sialate O-acetylesterase
MKVEGDKIRIFFDHAAGLKARDGKPLDWFTIAAADRNFVPAEATIEPAERSGLKEDTVVVRSPAVKQPVAVRFAWSGIAQPNFINGAGLPASPFRTDDWPGILETK